MSGQISRHTISVGRAKRPGMLAADDRLVGIVVEDRSDRARADPDRLARGEHDPDRRLQALRPFAGRPRGVAAQSKARNRAPISPPPAKKVGAALTGPVSAIRLSGFINALLLDTLGCRSGRRLVAAAVPDHACTCKAWRSRCPGRGRPVTAESCPLAWTGVCAGGVGCLRGPSGVDRRWAFALRVRRSFQVTVGPIDVRVVQPKTPRAPPSTISRGTRFAWISACIRRNPND